MIICGPILKHINNKKGECMKRNTIYNRGEELSNILNDAVISIVKEVYSKSVGTITISALVTLWSAGKGFFALCRGLSSAYEVEETNEFIKFRIRGIIYTIIFILLVVSSLILLVLLQKTPIS